MAFSNHTTRLTVLSNVESAPRISIKGRYKEKAKYNVPGPGSYTPQTASLTSHSVSIQGKYRSVSKPQYPGPGQYEAAEKPSKEIAPKYSFSQAGRFRERRFPRSPGPGTYSLKDLSKGKSVSLAPRWRPAKPKAMEPGPGTYVPGAADGFVYSSITWKPSFGTSQRPGAREIKMSTPGPGHYGAGNMLKFQPGGPQFSIKSRYPSRRPNLTPGPGAYGGITSLG